MSVTIGVNGGAHRFWRETDNEYVGLIPVPGVSGCSVTQQGKTISINGSNDVLNLSYSYTVQLHVDSTDTPQVREEYGMIVITCQKVKNIQRSLNAVVGALSGVRIGPSQPVV